MKKLLLGATLICATFCTQAQTVIEASGGLQSPESVAAYKEYLFVSNMGAKDSPNDGDGYISAHSRVDGKVLIAQYITGLNSPKGIKVIGNKLFVADGNKVLAYNLKTKERIWEADFSKMGVTDLNDISKKGCHSIYVTSTDKNALYTVCKNGKIKQVAVKGVIDGANGVDKKCHSLYVANFGHGAQADGSFGKMGVCSKKYTAYHSGGIYDGIQKIGKYLVVTDWVSKTENKGKLVVYKPCKKKFVEVALDKTIGGPSDIYNDKMNQMVWIPCMLENKLVAVPYTMIKK